MSRQVSTKNQILFNIIWSLITFVLGYGINFLITPYISDHLGIEAYGFIHLANTVISYVDIIAVAINSFASRYIGLAYHNHDYRKAEEYYSSVFIANIIFIVFSGILCFVFVVNIDSFLSIPPKLLSDIRILFVLVFLNYALSLISFMFTLTTFIKNQAGYTARNSGIGKILYALVLLYFIYLSRIKVYSIITAAIFSTVFVLLANYYRYRKHNSEIKLSASFFSKSKILEVLSSGIWNSINNIGNMLNSGLDLLITNQLLDSVVMGQISVVKQLANTVTSLSFLLTNAFQPKQLEAYSKNNEKELVSYLKISMKCMGVLSGVVIAGFVSLGRQFFSTWLPSQNTDILYKLSIIVLLGDVLVVVVRPLYYVNSLTNKLRLVCWITIISGLLNVAGMYLLIKDFGMGANAVVGTTMVLNIIQSLFITPFLASRFLGLKNRFVFFRIVLRHIVVTGICTSILWIISCFLNMKASWPILLCNIGFLGVIGLIIMCLGELSKKELSIILDKFLQLSVVQKMLKRQK